jgi:hypothetical protein
VACGSENISRTPSAMMRAIRFIPRCAIADGGCYLYGVIFLVISKEFTTRN